MNINRYNYETFFLLYVDNELSASERKSVELFVQENADLEPELRSILETTLPEEVINFKAKEQLYKKEIDEVAIQENLLLQLDNELDPVIAMHMESLIIADNNIENEWKILQQTKLDPTDKIVFENKSLLYRHEKDRVITMRFWKMAVAAVILFGGLFIGISLLKKSGPAENSTAKKMITPATQEKVNKNNTGTTNNNSFDSLQINISENIATVKGTEQNKAASSPVVNNNTAPGKRETVGDINLIKEEKNISPKISLDNINKDESNKTIAAVVSDKNRNPDTKNERPVEIANISMKDKIKAPEAQIIDYNSVPAMPDSYAKTTVFNESAPDNNNKIFYINEEKITRSKIGGLFRKVKRTIERNTNIKTGNGVTIAGFEIALNK